MEDRARGLVHEEARVEVREEGDGDHGDGRVVGHAYGGLHACGRACRDDRAYRGVCLHAFHHAK